MPKQRTYIPAEKVTSQQKVSQRIYELAASGISKRTIAVKLGITMEDFFTLLNYKVGDVQVYTVAYDAGRATFEEENVAVLEQAMETGNDALRAKIARENLKTMEEWAPATKAVKIEVSEGPKQFLFESFSEDEVQKIIQDNAEDIESDAEDKD